VCSAHWPPDYTEPDHVYPYDPDEEERSPAARIRICPTDLDHNPRPRFVLRCLLTVFGAAPDFFLFEQRHLPPSPPPPTSRFFGADISTDSSEAKRKRKKRRFDQAIREGRAVPSEGKPLALRIRFVTLQNELITREGHTWLYKHKNGSLVQKITTQDPS